MTAPAVTFDAVEAAYYRARYHYAAYEFEEAAKRLARLLRAPQRRYSPDQPRAPAGTPEGGQWVDAGGGSSSSASADGSYQEAQNRRTSEPVIRIIGNKPYRLTARQASNLENSEIRLRAAEKDVRTLWPEYSPRTGASGTDPKSQIAANNFVAQEMEEVARYIRANQYDIGKGKNAPREAIAALRMNRDHGTRLERPRTGREEGYDFVDTRNGYGYDMVGTDSGNPRFNFRGMLDKFDFKLETKRNLRFVVDLSGLRPEQREIAKRHIANKSPDDKARIRILE